MTKDDNTARSTGRLLLEAAPGGLSLVQDLLNSAGMPAFAVPDLLADATVAQGWLNASLRTWADQTGRTSPGIVISAADLPALHELRSHVRDWLTNEAGNQRPHPLNVDVSLSDGRLAYEPRDEGAAAVASLVHIEALLASHTGTWRRLKTCANPACGAAFYDLSRNGTRVWHDMKTCGNTMNLRASRARRRKTEEPPVNPAPPRQPA